ncbi:hypothetical protein BMS3Abin04_02123 [bacterium BMS3Abin04]|nr:hypothetical protein BMS3Abin04_02123 [bacterium BMS3Abin04]
MNRIINILSILLLLAFLFSCGADDPEEQGNSLGGDTNIPLAQVGNTGYSVIEMNGNYTRLDGIEITKNENGVANIHVSTNISQMTGLSNVADLVSTIYPSFINDNGKINADLKYKITSEGIQDFNNIDGKAHTLVKYDANVGDTYSLKLSNGETITRKVVAKSDKDDFQWGMLYIKTITIEQNAVAPGVKKYIFRANHKFGLVFVEALMEDGTSVGMYVYPSNY